MICPQCQRTNLTPPPGMHRCRCGAWYQVYAKGERHIGDAPVPSDLSWPRPTPRPQQGISLWRVLGLILAYTLLIAGLIGLMIQTLDDPDTPDSRPRRTRPSSYVPDR